MNSKETIVIISNLYKKDKERLKSIYKTYKDLFLNDNINYFFEIHTPFSVKKNNLFDIDLIIRKNVDFDKNNCRLIGSINMLDDENIMAIEMTLGNNVFATKTLKYYTDGKTFFMETIFIHNRNIMANFIENGVEL